MNHQKLLCLYVLFRESQGKYSHHWAHRKTGTRFYDTSSVRAKVPPLSAFSGVTLLGWINITWRVNQASFSKNFSTFFKYANTALSFLCLLMKYQNEDNFSNYVLLSFICEISDTQPEAILPPRGHWQGLKTFLVVTI